jgi:hypothetical protein
MHPEVRQEGEGRCPECGMALEPERQASVAAAAEERRVEDRASQSYVPLLVIFALLLAGTALLAWKALAAGTFSVQATIMGFMAGFFLVFAGFKLMDLRGFAKGYATYDLLAQRLFAYGYAYPFVELAFGLAMLAGIAAPALLGAEVVVMGFSGVGVALKVAKRERFRCACLGTFLKLPLTSITLLEDFGMAALALALLVLG